MKSNILFFVVLVVGVGAYYALSNDSHEDPSSTSELEDNIDRDRSRPSVPNRALPQSVNAETSLLKNGNFERSLEGWGYDTGIFWSDNGGIDEGGALLINPPEVVKESRVINAKGVEQCVSIRAGAIYGIEASFRYLEKLPQRPSVNRIHLTWYDGANCSQGGQYGGYVEPGLEANVWQQLLKRNLSPSLGARSAKIKVEQRQDGSNSAEAIWDNVHFFEISYQKPAPSSGIGSAVYTKEIGENTVQNPTFDNDINHWSPKRSDRLNWRLVDDVDHNGVMAATLTNTRDSSMGTGSFNQCINIGTHQRYQLGARVRIDLESAQRGGGRLRATWYQGLDCRGASRGARHHADVDRDSRTWQNLQVDDLVPLEGSKSVNIGIVHSIDGKGEHTLLWDNFYFRAY